MCGIAGWIGTSETSMSDAECMSYLLQHRGPDAQGSLNLPEATLIHTRLSIIDLSETGAQPMSNEDGSVWTIFNGEIYNHHSIHTQLAAKGHSFRGRSDTEIIPHLYEEVGTTFVEQLRGMFTIAVYDVVRRKLMLARDRFGIKPLFFAPTPTRLAFASELHALRSLPHVDIRPNRQAIYDFAALFYIPAPETFYQGVYALQPGEILEAEFDGERIVWRTRIYHQWTITPNFSLSLDEAAECADSLVKTAVSQQLESDVPLGSLLSGGIDSSLVSTSAQAALDHPLHTFNVRFPDREYDETWAALAVAEQIHSQHQTLNIEGQGGSWEYITGLLRHAGQPFADTSVFAVENVCRLMRQHVTVALSGDGGDEAFGGYEFYDHAPKLAILERLPMRRIGLLVGATTARTLGKQNLSYRLHEMAQANDRTALVQTMFVWIREQEHQTLCRATGLLPVRRYFEKQWEHYLPSNASVTEQISAQMTEINTRMTLPNDFLFKVDIASMRNSLEVRVPMLDEDLFQFGLSLPHNLKIQAGVSKQVLRAVAKRYLPENVANKPKWGFGIPVDKWVNSDFKRQLRHTLLDKSSPLSEYFYPKVYIPIIEAFSSGETVPGISRIGLYQRTIMLLSLHLSLTERAAPAICSSY
jgi:asparagine synthase (glutamine-hydrolysing)